MNDEFHLFLQSLTSRSFAWWVFDRRLKSRDVANLVAAHAGWAPAKLLCRQTLSGLPAALRAVAKARFSDLWTMPEYDKNHKGLLIMHQSRKCDDRTVLSVSRDEVCLLRRTQRRLRRTTSKTFRRENESISHQHHSLSRQHATR